MTRHDLSAWQQARNLTGVQMASMLGISRVTYSRWVHGHQRIAHWAQSVISLCEVDDILETPTAATSRKERQ